MTDLILAPETRPFAIALGVAVALALVEILSMLFGFTLFGDSGGDADAGVDLDSGVDADAGVDAGADSGFDADGGLDAEADLEAGSGGGQQGSLVSAALGWLNPGRVPFPILLGAACALFGLIGFALQSFAAGISGYLSSWIASIGALAAAAPALRGTTAVLGLILPKDETEAVSEASLVGLTATVVDARVAENLPGRAQLRDQYRTLHNVRVLPAAPDQSFQRGEEVVLVRYRRKGLFDAAPLPVSVD